ncbi:energy-coupling factor ABC transporter ATP-binding protein [Methanohalophilus mahii]|jgi:cobalt/nickel transport system ATP-binding protein|uniref:ABC transporter related protein n=1 Tax=Methanohalophilus mahii (strain ATCC 35705 / DSM 5219 / SLP) TaxID=547558 RepID=D5E7M0_METMS|nr:ATP-binding cassette domain-containing protein [Methanohalophilus mahii]ADE37158.1 ABC transporter related protein [Methanohalophilus mahii DSM 5219]
MKKEAIQISSLEYSYPDGKKALNNVNMKIFEGEKVTIMGPNGAGKTTLLLNINGTVKNPSPSVSIFGKSISSMDIVEKIQNVGVVFEDPDDQLFMPTVYDDVAFGPANMGLYKDEVDERVRDALLRVGMEGYGAHVPHHLSSGQKKKVAIAAVISMHPRIIVLDEPTANLDPKSKSELINLLEKLNKDKNTTIITVTHDVNTISRLADRIYVLNQTVVAEGTPYEIFSNKELLAGHNLESPDTLQLFHMLAHLGYRCNQHPLSVNEAAENLIYTMEKNNNLIQLNMNSSAYENIKQLTKLQTDND